LGYWLSGFFGIPADNNIFTQIAFAVVLVGNFSCKRNCDPDLEFRGAT